MKTITRSCCHRNFALLSVALIAAFSAVAPLACRSTDPQAGYVSGDLHRRDIRTVYVEMFDSRTFHRQIEYELTHALALQLELHTPYKIASDRGRADTIIYGSVERVTERVLTQQRQLDRPIADQVVLLAEVTWKDLRNGELLMDRKKFRLSSQYATMLAAGRTSAARAAANEMAVRIVEDLEKPWWRQTPATQQSSENPND